MDKLKDTIETKYYWRPEFLIKLEWAEMAANEGAEPLKIAEYIADQLFQKAA